MLCCVSDCGNAAMYTLAALCQKHYFRLRRNGHVNLKGAKPRIEDDRGYQFLHAPDHPLVTKGQIYVAEHRIVLYEAIGPGPMCCELCGKAMTWATCQADHIDENPRNNARSNLRPLCRRCNTWRSMPEPVEWNRTHVIEFEGKRLTPAEWARDPRVSVSGPTIILRKKAGMSDEQALFAPKVTHNGKGRVYAGPPRPQIQVTAAGQTMTPAQWARQPGVNVSDVTIRKRLRMGMSPEWAIYTPPSNTNGAKPKAPPPVPTTPKETA